MTISRTTEYLSAGALLLSGGLWLGMVSSQAADTAATVDGLPEKVATLDERTRAIKESIDDLKKQQAEQARLILEAIRKKT